MIIGDTYRRDGGWDEGWIFFAAKIHFSKRKQTLVKINQH
jgi:hypothetical protein